MNDEDLQDPKNSWYFNKGDRDVLRSEYIDKNVKKAEEIGHQDPYGVLGQQAGEMARFQEALQPQMPQGDAGISPEQLKDHPGHDRLRLDQPYTSGERQDPNDPRWKEIYDTNGDGIVDHRDSASGLETAANLLVNPITEIAGGLGLGSHNLAGERKHAYTSGTGTADLETNFREGMNAWRGASLDLINGALTMPESTVRSFMGEEFDKQRLYFDPKRFLNIEDPYQGTSIGRGARVLRSFILGDKLAGSLLNNIHGYRALQGKGLFQAGIGRHKVPVRGGELAQAMLRDGLVMKSSVYRHEDWSEAIETLSGINPMLGQAAGFIAVGEYDHPAVKEIKSTFEGIGSPVLFSAFWAFARSGVKAVKAQHFRVTSKKLLPATKKLPPAPGTFGRPAVDELGRIIDSHLDQADEMGQQQLIDEATEQLELPLEGFESKSRIRGDKNRPIVNSWQGIHTSTNLPSNLLKQLDMLEELPLGYGSTDSPLTSLQAELLAKDVGAAADYLQGKAIELLGEPYYQGLLKDLGGNRVNFAKVFGSSFRRFQDMVGRDAGNLSTEDFWRPITQAFEEAPYEAGRGADTLKYQAWALENVVVSDLVNGALFKDLRSRAKAAREIIDIGDIFAPDAPMKGIADRLIFGLTNVKKARYMVSKELLELPTNQRIAAIAQRTADLHDETVDGVRLMMQFLKESDSDELAQGILEVFSMSNKIHNWKDFDAWMKQKIRGGEFGNHSSEGAMMRELGGVMVNSILSGPKTPLRAIIGTTSNAYLNELTTLLGAGIRAPLGGDRAVLHASATSAKAMFDLIPDAFKVFKNNLDSYFSGDISTIRSRYSTYTKNDQNWNLMGQWAERNGTNGDKAAYYIANTARQLNDNKFLTWSSRVMGATDETFRWLMAKSRARKNALLKVMRENPNIDITPEMLKQAEEIEFRGLHDLEGNIDITKDKYLERTFKEATLTTELQGFSKGLDTLMNRYPLTKPFFLFARTGINGLKMSVKHLPLVGALVNESRDILMASIKNIDDGSLLKYGIESADDLASAKNMIIGRQALGSAVVAAVSHKYMSGGLTGNGPADASMKKMWVDAGWTPRSIKIGNTWVGYDSLEPFNLVLANIADVGDNMDLMGPQYSEERLQLVVAALGKGASSKTYLQGIGQLFDVLSGDAGYASQKILANLVNNQMPLAGMRAEIGNIISPNMRELNADFSNHIANRNPILKNTLPIKYDMLNGKPVRPWNFFEAAFNSVSPIQLRMEKGEGRQLLFNSGYDLRIAAWSAPDGTNLKDSPQVRSLFQQAIGNTDIEEQLNILAANPSIQASIAEMRKDRANGTFELDPMKSYMHNVAIRRLLDAKTREAWATLLANPLVQELKQEQLNLGLKNQTRLMETQNLLRTPK